MNEWRRWVGLPLRIILWFFMLFTITPIWFFGSLTLPDVDSLDMISLWRDWVWIFE